jgi:hypothetical protein
MLQLGPTLVQTLPLRYYVFMGALFQKTCSFRLPPWTMGGRQHNKATGGRRQIEAKGAKLQKTRLLSSSSTFIIIIDYANDE